VLSDAEVTAAIAVKDRDAAKGWFDTKLGLTPEREAGDGVLYRCGNNSTLFLYESGFAGTAQNTVAAWRVSDLEREMEELRSRGVTFEEYDFPGLTTKNGIAEFEGGRGAWFKDPDGNIFALNEER
jgi:catechol 2,3-dioxygenase-like lactoylglutathione lyase family enzyme